MSFSLVLYHHLFLLAKLLSHIGRQEEALKGCQRGHWAPSTTCKCAPLRNPVWGLTSSFFLLTTLLSNLERREEAVELHRLILAMMHPELFSSYLVHFFHIFAIWLSNIGCQEEEALKAVEEAVELPRSLPKSVQPQATKEFCIGSQRCCNISLWNWTSGNPGTRSYQVNI